MEKGVAIEAGVSGILGFILDIDYENSKSLGHKSSALSFNAKINLLTDLKFVPKEIAKQFALFAEIRNKFAHVQKVDNFTKCFEILKDNKKYFVECFGKSLPPETDGEIELSVCFDLLCMHLGIWMNLILSRSHYLKSQELKKTVVVEMLRTFFGSASVEGEDDKHFLDQVDEIIQQIGQDPEFITSVEDIIKTGEKHEGRTKC